MNQLKSRKYVEKGRITEFSKNVKNLPSEERPIFEKIGELSKSRRPFKFRSRKIELQIINESLEKDQIDVTLPGSFNLWKPTL